MGILAHLSLCKKKWRENSMKGRIQITSKNDLSILGWPPPLALQSRDIHSIRQPASRLQVCESSSPKYTAFEELPIRSSMDWGG